MSGGPKVSGVYAVCGPNGVYVGESYDCWNRGTLELAAVLGLECGIVREMPGASRLELVRAEAEVAKIFQKRGMVILSKYLTYSAPQQYRAFRVYKKVAPRVPPTPSRRNLGIFRLYQQGETITGIARSCFLSRQRVSQIVQQCQRLGIKFETKMTVEAAV